MIKCQICDSNKFTHYSKINDFTLLECENCGFIWLHPLPKIEDVQKIYVNAYQHTSTSYYAKTKKKMVRSRRRAKILKKYINKSKDIRFLDVGSNGGFMVEAARLEGFDSTGIEIDPYSIDYANKYYNKNRFFEGTIETFYSQYPEEKFDIIYCSEVIEHLVDINKFIETMKNLLSSDGIIFLTTPDIKHWRRPKELSSWDAYCPPDHCLYFDNKSIKILLNKFNLKIIKKFIAFKPGIKLLAKPYVT